MSWAAIEACNCSSTASDCVEPKFFCTVPTAANVGTSAPSAILTCCNAMSTLYIAVVINGCSLRLRAIAPSSVRGESRSTGGAGASRDAGGTPITCRYWACAVT